MKYPSTRFPSIDPLVFFHEFQRKYKHMRTPTNTAWGSSLVGSGWCIRTPFRMLIGTGVTPNSRSLQQRPHWGLNTGTLHREYCDWTKHLELSFSVLRLNSDAQTIGRVQLKEAATEGILAEKGIGIEVNNYALVGEGYGTARDTVALGTLNDDRLAHVKIVKTNTEVQFWINGVLRGVLTGNAVPNVAGTAVCRLPISIMNGAAGGVDAQLHLGNPQTVQAW